MKCVQFKKNALIVRVTDVYASELVLSGVAEYVAKSAWKDQQKDMDTLKKVPWND